MSNNVDKSLHGLEGEWGGKQDTIRYEILGSGNQPQGWEIPVLPTL